MRREIKGNGIDDLMAFCYENKTSVHYGISSFITKFKRFFLFISLIMIHGGFSMLCDLA